MAEGVPVPGVGQRTCDVCDRVGVRAFKTLIGETGDFTVCTNRLACLRRKCEGDARRSYKGIHDNGDA